MSQVEVVGIRVEMPANQPVVLLRDVEENRFLPIWIGPQEANAIIQAQQGVEALRPLTHDLLLGALREYGASVKSVTLTEVRDHVFYAELGLSDGKTLSARPSDALVLALKAGIAIDADPRMLEEFAIEMPAENDLEVSRFRDFLDSVSPEDFGD